MKRFELRTGYIETDGVNVPTEEKGFDDFYDALLEYGERDTRTDKQGRRYWKEIIDFEDSGCVLIRSCQHKPKPKRKLVKEYHVVADTCTGYLKAIQAEPDRSKWPPLGEWGELLSAYHYTKDASKEMQYIIHDLPYEAAVLRVKVRPDAIEEVLLAYEIVEE